ncbi:MAG: transposase [Chitinophagaceae bacterium]
MSKKQRSNRSGPQELFYTEAFKRKIVNEVLSGKLNKHQASKIYGIKGNATILYWIRQSHGLKGFEKGARSIGNFTEMKQNLHDKKLEEENKELRELLRIAELRADLWQHAIEKAEEKLKIDILKKYCARQFNPSRNKDQRNK